MRQFEKAKLLTVSKKASLFLLMGVAFFFISAPVAKAGNGDISVTQTKTETIAADLSGATVEVNCDGAYTALTGTTDASGTIAAQAAPGGATCDTNEEPMSYRVSKDGYVTKTVTGLTYLTGAQNDLAISGVQYTYKITAISSETVGTDLLTAGTTLSVGDGTGQNACTRSGAAFYCPVVAANCDAAPTAAIARDGYVTKTNYAFAAGGTLRSAPTDAQTGGTVTSVQYAYKVTGITAEATSASILTTATALSIGDTTGKDACTRSGSVWYCPVLLADSDGTLKGNVVVDGYVQPAAYSALTDATARSSATDAQVATVTISGIQYALKVTVYDANSSGIVVSGATVTAGNLLATSCAEAGSTGVYYCAVPLADTATTAQAAKGGYTTEVTTYTDRTAVTDAQGSVNIRITPGSTGGGGTNPVSCTSNWTCDNWSACANGTQTRVCHDTNYCTTSTNVPALSQACGAEAVEEKVIICHMQSGDPATGQTMEIDKSDLASYQAQGDTLGACMSSNNTPTSTPPTLEPSEEPQTYFDPADEETLLNSLNQTRDDASEAKYELLVTADSKAFGVSWTQAQINEATTFVTYGIDEGTQSLGAGARRAILRDYLQTTGYSDIRWDDIVRLSNGQIPVGRNLTAEQNQLGNVLRTFKTIYGHNPNFQDANETLAWNTLMYRIYFPRDLVKEAAGIVKFKQLFGKTPTTPFQWAVVRVLAYIKQ